MSALDAFELEQIGRDPVAFAASLKTALSAPVSGRRNVLGRCGLSPPLPRTRSMIWLPPGRWRLDCEPLFRTLQSAHFDAVGREIDGLAREEALKKRAESAELELATAVEHAERQLGRKESLRDTIRKYQAGERAAKMREEALKAELAALKQEVGDLKADVVMKLSDAQIFALVRSEGRDPVAEAASMRRNLDKVIAQDEKEAAWAAREAELVARAEKAEQSLAVVALGVKRFRHAHNEQPSFFVVIKRETEQPEVYTFDRRDDAVAFFQQAGRQWTDTYLLVPLRDVDAERTQWSSERSLHRLKVEAMITKEARWAAERAGMKRQVADLRDALSVRGTRQAALLTERAEKAETALEAERAHRVAVHHHDDAESIEDGQAKIDTLTARLRETERLGWRTRDALRECEHAAGCQIEPHGPSLSEPGICNACDEVRAWDAFVAALPPPPQESSKP